MKVVTILLIAIFLLVVRIERMLAFALTFPGHTVQWPINLLMLFSFILFIYAIYSIIKDSTKKK